MTVEQDREQLDLELINRARLDPAGEAARYGLADLSSGTSTTITAAAKQVLSFNASLYASASGHTSYLMSSDTFSHTGSGGSSAAQRMAAAGFGPVGSVWSGENLAWVGTTGTLDQNASVLENHKNLFLSAGHRANMLNGVYEELGVSVGYDASYQGYKGQVITENYGARTTAEVFVTGVSYTDSNNDDFYSIGESNAGRTVQLLQNGAQIATSVTSASGGYGMGTTANGSIEVVFSNGGLAAAEGAVISVSGQNVKVDLTDSNTIETNVSASLTRAALNLRLIGIDNVNGTGNELNNVITGNKGNNTLAGAAGNDTLNGGEGNDTFDGGAGDDAINGGIGSDTLVFDGLRSAYDVAYASATQVFTIHNGDGSVDTVTGVENFQFTDGVVSAAQLDRKSVV